jgi:asparagine synthase (glutamine-hydrolysing)
MCGICGIMGPERAGPDTPYQVRAMAQRIAHRGPDGEGFWDTPHGTLGHRRLAIIDVAGGNQPMFNEDDSLTVVLNGEIYNFAELRTELVRLGHRFRTRSDTEVLLHGYEEWGVELLGRLRGMFAFALWDSRRQRLFIARDRLGIKPLYYWLDPRTRQLSFASEIKALFANPEVPRTPNRERLPEYLLFRSVSGSETLFAGILELEPGSYALLDANGFALHRYWAPAPPQREISLDSAIEEGRVLIEDAVRSHLVSDVGLGTITSGGLDSSLVSTIAARAMEGPIDTFCLGFTDPALDERPYAREVARRIGARHHETLLTAGIFAAELDGLTWMHDEPLSHPNAIAMHRVFHLARHETGLPVLLSGEGADEVFGGYGWYRAAFRRARIIRLLGARLSSALLHAVLRGPARDLANPDYLLLANALGRDSELRGLPAVEAAVLRRRTEYETFCTGPEDLFRYDQLTYLQPLLQRQDRMSMAVGLEARVPFLDHPLVEWANNLRASVKLGDGKPKRLLRRLADGFLPREIIDRPKVGFALPLAEWLRGPLRERLEVIRQPESLARSLLPAAAIARTMEEHDAGKRDRATVLWTLLALEVWRERFFTAAAEPVSARIVPSPS